MTQANPFRVRSEDVPQHLFRYRSLSSPGERDRVRDLIAHRRLHFARASDFNDPFDVHIEAAYEASNLVVEAYWRQHVHERGDQGHDPRRRIRQLSHMRHTPTGRAELNAMLLGSFARHGIACFCEHDANALLWAHYADGHRGVALRFRMSEANRLALAMQDILVLPVEYTRTYPDVNFYTSDRDEKLQAFLATKSSDWAHECEWRFILVDSHGLLALREPLLDGVIFGLRTSPEVETHVLEWIAEANTPIEVMRVRQKPRSFELEVVAT